MATLAPASQALDWRGRLRSAWRMLLFVLVYLFLLFGWVMLGAMLLPNATRTVSVEFAVLSATAGFLAVVMATGLFLGGVERRPLDFVGLGFEAGWLRQIGVGFLLGLAMMVAIVLLEWGTGHLRIAWSGVPPATTAARLLLFFLVFLVGAAHEEMVSRGYPFQRLMEVLGVPLAVVGQAAIFAGLHYWNPHSSLLGSVNTMLVGVLFAVAYLQTGRLWLPIGLHWGWNFFEAAFGLPVSGITIEEMPLVAKFRGSELFHGGGYGPEAALPASVVIAVTTVAFFLRGRRPMAPASSKDVA